MVVESIEIGRLLVSAENDNALAFADPSALGRGVESALQRALADQNWSEPPNPISLHRVDAGSVEWNAGEGQAGTARAIAERIAGVLSRAASGL